MNKRVFNALRKIATESISEPPYSRADLEYLGMLPTKDELKDNFSEQTEVSDAPEIYYDITENQQQKVPPAVEDIRQYQARVNARLIAPFGTDKYFDTRKHLLNYGRTKQYNYINSANPKPMPVYSGKKLTEDERKKLDALERLQTNNSRRNPYSKTV